MSAAALRQGVLVGRYPRCDISAANAPLSEAVSRVHALFLELDGAVRVFDTGSTHCVIHQERDANGMELPPDRPTSLLLGPCDEITWEPAGEPAEEPAG